MVQARFMGETLHPLPLLQGTATTLSGGPELCPNLRVGVEGGGRERRRGRLLQARHKETSFSLGSMATLRRGSAYSVLPSLPAGLGGPRWPLTCRPSPGSRLPGLGPRGSRGRGSGRRVDLRQPGPRGAQGTTTTMSRDAEGVTRGSVARVPGLWDARGFLLARGSDLAVLGFGAPRVPEQQGGLPPRSWVALCLEVCGCSKQILGGPGRSGLRALGPGNRVRGWRSPLSRWGARAPPLQAARPCGPLPRPGAG